jgi:FKBP-type peptidyl-prolyl cis-trans isomerase
LTTDYTDATDAEDLSVPSVKSAAKFILVLGLAALFTAPTAHAQREKLPPEDLEFVQKNWPEAKKTTTGLRYIVLREGQGEKPVAGSKCAVVYVGRLLDGKVFNQLDDRANPFVFRIRRGEVIEGWDQILQMMRVGEKRLVVIPGELAYGTRGRPPDIPRNATLVFEIELLEIRKD